MENVRERLGQRPLVGYFRSLLQERGLSPVVGAVLMVGITIVLASLVAFFVLGIEGPTEHTGDVQIIENAEEGEITVTFSEGGTTDHFRIVTAEGEWSLLELGDSITISATSEVFAISVIDSGDEELVRMYEPNDITLAHSTNPPTQGSCQAIIDDTDGDGSEGDPHEISDVQELQCINVEPDSNYVQTDDILATGTATWHDGQGFVPIGDTASSNNGEYDGDNGPFTGVYDGNGYTIDGLTIDQSIATTGEERDYIGLFGNIEGGGEVRDLTLTDSDIHGNEAVGGVVGRLHAGEVTRVSIDGTVTGDGGYVGGAVGAGGVDWGAGTVRVENVDASVTVTGSNVNDEWYAGGLIGEFGSSDNFDVHIVDSYADGDVEGHRYVAGLAAKTYGDIDNSHAEGDVVSTLGEGENSYAAGLSGYVVGDTTNSTASGDVTANGARVGGLLGDNGAPHHTDEGGNVQGSSASGNVTSEDRKIGGLIGNIRMGSVHNSHATGDVSGDSYVGGFIGEIENRADEGVEDITISESSAEGEVTASGMRSAGFVGYVGLGGTAISQSYFTGEVTTGSSNAGGFTGYLRNGATIEDSYVIGDVTTSGSYSGGFVGAVTEESTVSQSYYVGTFDADGSYVAAFVGCEGCVDGGEVTDSYVNDDAHDTINGAEPLDIEDMKGDAAEENMFDFRDVWVVVTDDHPDLSWE